jgi:hypothetical protein
MVQEITVFGWSYPTRQSTNPRKEARRFGENGQFLRVDDARRSKFIGSKHNNATGISFRSFHNFMTHDLKNRLISLK